MLRSKPKLTKPKTTPTTASSPDYPPEAAADVMDYVLFTASTVPGFNVLPPLPIFGTSARSDRCLIRLWPPPLRSCPVLDEPAPHEPDRRRRRIQTPVEAYQDAFDGPGVRFGKAEFQDLPPGPAGRGTPLEYLMTEIHDAVVRLMRVDGDDKEHAARDLAAALIVRYRYGAAIRFGRGVYRRWRYFSTDPDTARRARLWDQIAHLRAHDAFDALLSDAGKVAELYVAWLANVRRDGDWSVGVDDGGRFTVPARRLGERG